MHDDDGQDEPTDLEGLLERMDEAARDRERVTLGDVLESVGSRSFGPLLLLAGLIMLAPIIGDIPGVPTLMGAIVVLTAVQLLFRREHFWLPQWLLRRSIESGKLRKAVGWSQRPATWVDKFLRPRLEAFVHGPGTIAIAVVGVAIALMTPAMEVVPFSANAAGLVLTAFGLALVARDGLLAVSAFVIAAATFAVVVYSLV